MPNTKDIIAKFALLYLFLLGIATITLGLFVIAFVASLKDDALSDPTELSIPQLSPANWGSSWQLGRHGGNSAWLGGLDKGHEITWRIEYAAEDSTRLVAPKISVALGRSVLKRGEDETSAAPYIADLQLIGENTSVEYTEISGTKRTDKVGDSQIWQFVLKNPDNGQDFSKVALDIAVPKGQVLINSNIPPNRIERRGRVASWDNVAPGLVTYVFKSYVRVIDDARSLSTGESLFLSWTANSFFIAFFKVLLTLVIACLGGYALARFSFTGSRIIFFLMLFSMMVPGQVLFISNYLVFRDIGLINTPWAVITAVVASGQVLIMKQFFESMPKEVEEAAIVDGANPLRIMWSIFLPNSKPAIASVVILGFQGAWNDFFWPLVVLTSPAESYTLPVGLLSLRNTYGVAGDWGLILAGSFLSTIPVLLIFILFQRYFVENDTSSAVKG